MHALPPKPVLCSVPFVHPSHSSIIEATAMASRADRDKRNSAGSKPEYSDPLPPGWEIKYPRNGCGLYYYDIHTQESIWSRPTAPSTREKRAERSNPRDDPLDKPLSTRNGKALILRVGRPTTGEDRHYHPGESARREERPLRSTQRTHSYKPDSYSPRDRESAPPPRRLPSPGDRNGVESSYPEAPSVSRARLLKIASVCYTNVQGNVHNPMIPLPQTLSVVIHHRTQKGHRLLVRCPPPPPHPLYYSACLLLPEWRTRHFADVSRSLGVELRHTIFCSFLYDFLTWTRGRSSWTRIPVVSPFLLFVSPFPLIFFFKALTKHSNSLPVSEAPFAGRRSRFSHADAPVQHNHGQSESCDVGM